MTQHPTDRFHILEDQLAMSADGGSGPWAVRPPGPQTRSVSCLTQKVLKLFCGQSFHSLEAVSGIRCSSLSLWSAESFRAFAGPARSVLPA